MERSNKTNEVAHYHACAMIFDGNYKKLRSLIDNNNAWDEAYNSIKEKGEVNPKEEYEILQKSLINLVLEESEDFPKYLSEIPNPPHGIYYKGQLPERTGVSIAIVGTRKATPHGKSVAGEIAKSLASAGVTIVSGLAFGIDASAHRGALAGEGKTVAVLGTGLERVSPSSHKILSEKILKHGGALVSEHPPHSKIYPSNFLQRNRIISGLSVGVIIVEAPKRSGSLATARFALEQNRDVFVIPGPINHPNYYGSHSLIRDGATLVRGADDILEELGIEKIEAKNYEPENELESSILSLIKMASSGAEANEIADKTESEIPEIQKALSFLTINNVIKNEGGRYFIR